MALPVTPGYVEALARLTPELFNFPDYPTLDAFVLEAVLDADAWMRVHMGTLYNLLDAPSARLQARAQACLAMENIVDSLKSQKVYGTHFAYISEESPEYQALIDLNWGERAMAYLDTWVTIELGAARAFALPRFLVTPSIGPKEKLIDPTFANQTTQYSEELDFARGLTDPDIGTLRR